MITICIPTNLSNRDLDNINNNIIPKISSHQKVQIRIYVNNSINTLDKIKTSNITGIVNLGKVESIGKVRNLIISDFLSISQNSDFMLFLDADDELDILDTPYLDPNSTYLLNRVCVFENGSEIENKAILNFRDYFLTFNNFIFCTGVLISRSTIINIMNKYGINRLFFDRSISEERLLIPILLDSYDIRTCDRLTYCYKAHSEGLSSKYDPYLINAIKDANYMKGKLSDENYNIFIQRLRWEVGRKLTKETNPKSLNELKYLTDLMTKAYAIKNAPRISVIITGFGGTGKSELIRKLGQRFTTLRLVPEITDSRLDKVRPGENHDKFIPTSEFMSLYNFIDRYPYIDELVYNNELDKVKSVSEKLKIKSHTFIFYIKLGPRYVDRSDKYNHVKEYEDNYRTLIAMLIELGFPVIVNEDYRIIDYNCDDIRMLLN